MIDKKGRLYEEFEFDRFESKVINLFWDVMYNTYLTFKCIPQIPTCFYGMNL
jgi:hypothetical protein